MVHLRGCAFVLCALAATALHAQTAPASGRTVVQRYCVGCHNGTVKTAGISLQGLDPADAGANAAVWEKVLRKVRTGEMPPTTAPQLPASVASSFAAALEGALDRHAAANANAGRPALHRLNRAEYGNAIRDLLALDIDAGATLPADDSGYGFDNIADVLSMSPALLERYISTARRVSRLAVGDLAMKASAEEYAPKRDPRARGPRTDRVSDDLPFNSMGGHSFRHYFPLDAEYVIRVRGAGDREVRLPMKAGPHTVGVTFIRDATIEESEGGRGFRGGFGAPGAMGPAPMIDMDLRIDGVRVKRWSVAGRGGPPAVGAVVVDGPHAATGRGETPSRAAIFVCRPASVAEEPGCARRIVTTLARRAFRRPVTDADVRPLMAFYDDARRNGGFDQGIEAALRAMLVSPDFLFRAEADPKGAAPGSNYRLGDLELASRLSFFLWSSIPDEELLSLAEKSKLKDPAIFDQQVRRMVEDPKSAAFVSNFAGQWLYLRNLDLVTPDVIEFPGFDEPLREGFRRESELLLASILRENRGILDLLNADYTYLNERLADHYGIGGVYGSHFRRVELSSPRRRGLLGHGSILTATSYPNRTSVVLRGKWVLENLLGAPPPPPPPDVPELKPQSSDGKALSMRQQMELHRVNPTCASCHARMDPIGFALQNYDGIGKWRDTDAGEAIDASGKLPNGATFDGPSGLTNLLLTGHRDAFVENVTEKLLTYALGRGLEPYDKPTVRAIARQSARDNYRLGNLILAICRSTPFQMRRTLEK